MDQSQRFAVTVSHPHEGRAVLSVRGDLDLASAESLREPAAENLSRNGLIVLDMAGCGFVDSSGLRVLLSLTIHARETGSVLRLAALGPDATRVIELAGLQETLTAFADVDSALA